MAGERVLENPGSGERIVIRQTGPDTCGELLMFDVYLRPGGHVPGPHVHPRQEERFEVLAGRVRFTVGRRSLIAEQGASLAVPAGKAHWFGNAGDGEALVRVECRPALRMQELLETAVQRSTSTSAWSRLLEVALIPFDFPLELAVPLIPQSVMAPLLSPLAWLRARTRARLATK